MNTKVFIVICVFALVSSGCRKDDSGTNPPPPPQEDWTFPQDSTTNIKVFSEISSAAVGDAFDVKVILYNVTDVFGSAVELTYSSAHAQITSILAGPLFAPDTDILTVSHVDPGMNLASFGVTYRAGSGRSVTGSGVLFKLKCKGTSPGTAVFTINPAALEIRKTDNTIANPPIRPALSVNVH